MYVNRRRRQFCPEDVYQCMADFYLVDIHVTATAAPVGRGNGKNQNDEPE